MGRTSRLADAYDSGGDRATCEQLPDAGRQRTRDVPEWHAALTADHGSVWVFWIVVFRDDKESRSGDQRLKGRLMLITRHTNDPAVQHSAGVRYVSDAA